MNSEYQTPHPHPHDNAFAIYYVCENIMENGTFVFFKILLKFV